MDSFITVEKYVQATLKRLQADGLVLQELDDFEWEELLPGIIDGAQLLSPTVSDEKVKDIIIGQSILSSNPHPAANTHVRGHHGVSQNPLAQTNTRGAVQTLPATVKTRGSSQPSLTAANARSSVAVKQSKLDLWLRAAKPSSPAIEVTSSPPTPLQPNHPVAEAPEGRGWKIFDHELEVATKYQLAKKDVRPLETWIPSQGHRQLFDLLKKCTRPDIWEHCVDGDKTFDRAFLLSLPTDDIGNVSGWYLIVLYNEIDDSWWRVYVGQSVDIPYRWEQHERASVNEAYQALVYEVWRGGKSVPEDKDLPYKAKFIRLGSDEGEYADDESGRQTFRNLGETFFALVFQSLQPTSLARWLSKDVEIQDEFRGTNVAVPITSNHGVRSLASVWSNPDPVARAYALKKAMAALVVADKVQRAEHYGTFTLGTRKGKNATFFRSAIFRSADPSKGDLASIRVKCRACGNERDDPTPAFVSLTGEYLVRPLMCHHCPLTAEEKKKKRKTAPQCLIPVDPAIPWIFSSTLKSMLNKHPERRAEYEGKPKPESPKESQRPQIGTSKFGHRAKRANFANGIFRDADPTLGEPETVSVKCKDCGWRREDTEPFYLTVTGEYVAHTLGCEDCEPSPGDKKMKRKTAVKMFLPVSATLKHVLLSSLDKKMRDPAKKKELMSKRPADDPSPGDHDEEPPKKKRHIFSMA